MLVALGICLAGVWLAGTQANSGQAPAAPVPFQPPRGYVCYRATEPLLIDGKLDEPSWQRVPWTDDFVDIEGDKKPKPRLRHARQNALGQSLFLPGSGNRGARTLGGFHHA